jgi:hypothetical protein
MTSDPIRDEGERPARFRLRVAEVLPWHGDQVRLDALPDILRACQGSPVQATLCAVCNEVLGSIPFTLITFIVPAAEDDCPQLVPCIATAIHLTCPIPDQREMCRMMFELLAVKQD